MNSDILLNHAMLVYFITTPVVASSWTSQDSMSSNTDQNGKQWFNFAMCERGQ